ncbi:MAG TPA: 2-oxoacid:acceptor oxidoreductase subunit alpha [Chloroflexi bacterium]|nr:2-oxoacid:acceptor oxidoreductase subunit alpha [Chloroflexota bacterium]
MSNESLVIRIGGEAGEGIVTIGETLVRIAAFSGLEVFTFRTYPAEIIGGQVMYQARIGREQVLSMGDDVDILVAANQLGHDEHIGELRSGGLLVYDSDAVTPAEGGDHLSYAVPFTQLAREINFLRGRNLIVVGFLTSLMGLPLDRAEQMVRRRLGKYKELLPSNLEALHKGYTHHQEHFAERPEFQIRPPEDGGEERLVMTGAQAIALGALAAGCRFYAGYPITPATDIMEFLSKELPRMGGAIIQAEDEIAAVTMAIGASFGGVKAMTATSGPGLALMIEALGLASMTEVPLVIVDAQRAGPSTGMPTKTSQGDLFLALYAGADEAPRFVLAPDSVEDSFYQMINAFNLAERFQMPVILLSDQAMATRVETIRPIDLSQIHQEKRRIPSLDRPEGNGYLRYALTEDGISPMAIPGMPGMTYTAEGLEHDESGAPSYVPEVHRAMTEKRFRKVETARKELHRWGLVNRWGDPQAEIAILSWGSTQSAVREAMERAAKEGILVEALFTKILLPMPDYEIRPFLEGKRAIIVPELNYQGMFAKVIEHRYSEQIIRNNIQVYRLNKYEGLPFKPGEIYAKIVEVAQRLTAGVLADRFLDEKLASV